MEPKFKRTYKYYGILGLDKSATTENIKHAYRLIIRKYHPDINKDPEVAEIAKKINEAFQVLSDTSKRLIYDNSEAECPECWTHEVRRTQGNDWTSFAWRCTHCGCNFTSVAQKREAEKSAPATEYEEYICPRCQKALTLDESLGLYRCRNQACKGVFSRYEMREYYSKSIRRKRSNAKPGIHSTDQQTNRKEINSFVFSSSEKLILKGICGISALATLYFAYYLIFEFSLLVLGLFIMVFGFTILSWYIHKYPRVISIIKSLIIIRDKKDE